MHHIYNANLALINKLEKQIPLTDREEADLQNLPSTLMLCYLNGFDDAKHRLANTRPLLKAHTDPTAYIAFKEAMRVLRKMKYNNYEDIGNR